MNIILVKKVSVVVDSISIHILSSLNMSKISFNENYIEEEGPE